MLFARVYVSCKFFRKHFVCVFFLFYFSFFLFSSLSIVVCFCRWRYWYYYCCCAHIVVHIIPPDLFHPPHRRWEMHLRHNFSAFLCKWLFFYAFHTLFVTCIYVCQSCSPLICRCMNASACVCVCARICVFYVGVLRCIVNMLLLLFACIVRSLVRSLHFTSLHIHTRTIPSHWIQYSMVHVCE